LIESKQHTVVLIAHRLSTIKNADKIAFIAEGKVQEFGSHEELLRISGGRYRRLVKSSKLNSTMASAGLTIAGIKEGMVRKETADEEEIDWEATVAKEAEDSFDLKRAKQLAKPDIPYLIVGTIGALMAGATDPAIGLLFAEMTTLFFRPVFPCPLPFGFGVPFGFETCPDYLGDTVNEYQQKSFQVAIWWAILGAGKLTGNVLMIWGFGIASERLSKRVRDMSFTALLRQEIAYFGTF
jgi:ATP-binding cassette, subfamily B (MDR/TAP), member 1